MNLEKKTQTVLESLNIYCSNESLRNELKTGILKKALFEAYEAGAYAATHRETNSSIERMRAQILSFKICSVCKKEIDGIYYLPPRTLKPICENCPGFQAGGVSKVL